MSFLPSDFFSFKKIANDFIPLACHIDHETTLTKNGEVMQTLAIISLDNNANTNGIFGENIRKAIRSSIETDLSDYSFWIHSIKISDKTILNIKLNSTGNSLYQFIRNEWENYQKTFDNYMVVTFLTILRTPMSLNIKPKNLMLFINNMLLYKTHNAWIKRSASLLSFVVDKVASYLEQYYSVKKLKIIKHEDIYISEQLEFWDRLVNFGDMQYPVPIADLSEIINRSVYKFDISTLFLKNDLEKKYCAFFTLKDNNNISPALISDIVLNLKNIIMFEIFHFETSSSAKQTYKNQINRINNKSIHEKLIPIVGLENFLPKNIKSELFCKHYGGLVIIANTYEDLKKEIKNMSDICAKTGIVFGFEDIGIERAFYSLFPGNFNNIAHYNIVPFNDTLSLVNSHKMDNDNISSYLNQKSLFIIPTLKKYPYAFGVLKNKSDILISGPKRNEAKNLFANIVTSFLSSEFKKTCIIDSSGLLMSFIEMSDGSYYNIDEHEEKNSPNFSPFGMQNVGTITHAEIITNIVIMMALSSGAKLSTESINKISLVATVAKNISEIVSQIPEIQEFFKDWAFGGRSDFLFNRKKDVIEEDFIKLNKSIVCFNIDDTAMLNRQLRSMVTYYILLKFLSICKETENNLIIIRNPIPLIDHHAFELDLDLIQKYAITKNVIFLFINDDSIECLNGMQTKICMKDILKNCDTKFHFGGTVVTSEYIENYNITDGESYAIQNINNLPNNAILNQNNITLPIYASSSCFDDNILEILRGGIEIESKIEKIKQDQGYSSSSDIIKFLEDGHVIHIDTNAEDLRIKKEKEVEEAGMQILNSA